MHQVSLHLPVSHSKLRPVWWELALVQPVHSCHSINRMSITHPCGAPQMECVEHDWWCRNVMTSNTDQMVGVNVQCTWNGVSGKIDDMVSISQADQMVGSTLSAINRESSPTAFSCQPTSGWITAVWITAKWRMEFHYVCCECDTSFSAHKEIHGQETG